MSKIAVAAALLLWCGQVFCEPVNLLGEWSMSPHFKLVGENETIIVTDPGEPTRENYAALSFEFLPGNVLIVAARGSDGEPNKATYLWNLDAKADQFSFVSKEGDTFEYHYRSIDRDTLLLVEDADEFFLVSLMRRLK